MTPALYISELRCPKCNHFLFQLSPKSVIYGCDYEKCMTAWRMVDGRLVEEMSAECSPSFTYCGGCSAWFTTRMSWKNCYTKSADPGGSER